MKMSLLLHNSVSYDTYFSTTDNKEKPLSLKKVNNKVKINLLILLIAFLFTGIFNSNSQATYTSGSNATQLATQLSNTGFTITNPVITNGASTQTGTFSNGISGVGLELDKGIVLTTANVDDVFNTDSRYTSDYGAMYEELGYYTTYNDPDLVTINTQAVYDVFVYEFDFTITGTEPKVFALDYQFASEEYPEYVCSEFNDIFGFFVSGGDLVGTSNIASVRGKNVAVNSINSGVSGVYADDVNLCDFENIDFFVDNEGDSANPGAIDIIFDGLTKTLRAYTILRPGISYHMKMTIADTSDDVLDSGIFIAPIQIFDLPAKADVDFDGIDDYINSAPFMEELGASTMSAWIKLDNVFSNAGYICGQSNFKLFVDAAGKLKTSVRTNTSSLEIPDANAPVLQKDLWYQATVVFDGSDGSLTLNLNGEKVWEGIGLGNKLDIDTTNFDVGRNSDSNDTYFNGSIDEVRVYDVALSEDQIEEQVYQEIENVGGLVYGSTIPKPIDKGSLSWNSLLLYYNMNLIYDITLIDASSTVKNGVVNNITTIQVQTAPLPYVANNTGDWTTKSTWEYGDFWDIDGLPNRDWMIVKVGNNAVLSTNNSHDLMGLIIDSGTELKIQNSQLLKNSSYLELDGTIDLEDESQLIQTIDSDLAVTSSGKIKRRQEGQSNLYRYNYWSSPVGAQNGTINNTDFTLSMLKDGNGNIQFTNANSPAVTTPATISTNWLYTYKNGLTYYDWSGFNENTPIEPGVGYSQKGAGVGSGDFQYIFEGKPNNGVIEIDVDDVGGAGSVPGVSKTEYLVGNPYPSAIDAHTFIDDNVSVISGTLYFWEHWGGNSHYLKEYEGGYATINKTGSVKAYQFVGLDGGTNNSQDGTKNAERYIPVSQGFMVEIIGTGKIEFNNDQRIFKTEALDDSQFFKGTNTKNKKENTSVLQKLRLEFSTPNNLKRELLFAFSEETTDGYDYGYDAKASEVFANDLLFVDNNENFVIQALSEITNEKTVDLFLKIKDEGDYTINMLETEAIDENQAIYLLDNETGAYHDLRSGDYVFNVTKGNYSERFKIVFESKTLSSEIVHLNNTVSVFTKKNKLFVKRLSEDVTQLNLVNTIGQQVLTLSNIKANTLETGFELNNMSTGIYIIDMTLKNGVKLTKKIMLN